MVCWLAPVVACVGLAACAGLAACGDKQLAALEAVRAEVCACKQPACAEAAMAKLPKTDIRSDHRTQALATAMLDCLAKIDQAATAAAASEDPDAPGSAAPGSAAPGSAGSATRP